MHTLAKRCKILVTTHSSNIFYTTAQNLDWIIADVWKQVYYNAKNVLAIVSSYEAICYREMLFYFIGTSTSWVYGRVSSYFSLPVVMSLPIMVTFWYVCFLDLKDHMFTTLQRCPRSMTWSPFFRVEHWTKRIFESPAAAICLQELDSHYSNSLESEIKMKQ